MYFPLSKPACETNFFNEELFFKVPSPEEFFPERVLSQVPSSSELLSEELFEFHQPQV
jgi:hypothetical protein